MRNVRTLLCRPISSENSPQKTPPLGIVFSGAAAEKEGFEIEYWDEQWDSQNALVEALQKTDVVGVSSFTGVQLRYAKKILIEAKRMGKITLFGGVHANIVSDQCLKESFIDYVAIGEGERTLPSFLGYLESGVPPAGIKGRDINYRPAPQLSTAEFISPLTEKTMRLFELSNRTNDVMLPSSRGCPYRCGFCLNSMVRERRYRMVRPEAWTSWLDRLLARMDVRWLQVGDDYLGNHDRIVTIGRILQERGIKWYPSFRADNFRRSGEEFAAQLNALGVTDLAIGVETGSDRLMAFIEKDETKEDILHAARCLAAVGIRPLYSFIVGFPTETKDETIATLNFADELHGIHGGNCNISLYNFTPYPGATLFAEAVKQGMRIPEKMGEWETFTRETVITNNSMSKEFRNLYHISGLHFHQQPGSKTDKNFPGKRRWLIKPFERLCDFRWRHRLFKWFSLEKFCIEFILKNLKKI